MTNTVIAPEKKKATVFMVPFKGREVMVVKLTLHDMGFTSDQQLGAVQGRAHDMGLSRLSMEELKAFRNFYQNQKFGEHLLAIVVHEGCNLWVLEKHVKEGIGITPLPSKHDSSWSPENIFCFKGK